MDLEHVIGTVVVAYSNLTLNLASNSTYHLKFLKNTKINRFFCWIRRGNLHLWSKYFLCHIDEKLYLQQCGTI